MSHSPFYVIDYNNYIIDCTLDIVLVHFAWNNDLAIFLRLIINFTALTASYHITDPKPNAKLMKNHFADRASSAKTWLMGVYSTIKSAAKNTICTIHITLSFANFGILFITNSEDELFV